MNCCIIHPELFDGQLLQNSKRPWVLVSSVAKVSKTLASHWTSTEN